MTTPAKPNGRELARVDYTKPTSLGGLDELARGMLPQIQAALPTFLAGHALRLVRCLLTECSRTPRLLECTPRSLLGGLVQAAQLGLEIGGPLGQCYLIPFRNRRGKGPTSAQLIPGYKGYIALAHRSGRCARVTPETVRKADVFKLIRGLHQDLIHEPDPSYTSEPIGYYAVIGLNSGGGDFEYLTKAQAEAHRDRYALAREGPWLTHFDQMAEKTAIRMLGKRMPLSVHWNAALALEEQAELGADQGLHRALIPGTGVDVGADLADRLGEEADDEKDPSETAGGGPGPGPTVPAPGREPVPPPAPDDNAAGLFETGNPEDDPLGPLR